MPSTTRRAACLSIAGGLAAFRGFAQNRPESFKIYSESPRLFLRPARLKLLRRERERQSLRWEQFETLWSGNAPFVEPGWSAALRYQITQDEATGKRAIVWAAGAQATDVRQIALVSDWCAPLLSPAEQNRIAAKLQRAATGAPPKSLNDARNKVFAAVAISESQPDTSEKAIREFFDNYWLGSFIPSLRDARARVTNADACAMMELLHVIRDNLNFDLRDTFPAWFRQYPLMHLMAHYPAPWPAGENEFRIPADETIQKTGPDIRKATLSRAAELAMVAYDANAASSQLVQGWVTNDRFLLRGPYGIPYEFLWANPYQPGLSYYHVPLVFRDDTLGSLFMRSSWDDDAKWLGYFANQLQLFEGGRIIVLNPELTRGPLDLDEGLVFFGKSMNRFVVPPARDEEHKWADVFIVGLKPHARYSIETDDEELDEAESDVGGTLFFPKTRSGVTIRLAPAPITTKVAAR